MTSSTRRLSILVAAPEIPKPDTNSADRRFTALLRMMTEAGHRVDFCRAARWDSATKVAPYERALEESGIAVGFHPGGFDWEWLDRALCRRPYDVAFFEYWHSAKDQIPRVRARQPWIRVVVDSVDVHFVRRNAELEVSGAGPEERARAALEEQGELAVYRQSDAVAVVTEEDRQVLAGLEGIPPLHFLPNVVPPRPRPAISRDPEVVFIGGFRHAPNVDGAIWFAQEIWPTILGAVPGARLSIIGHRPTPEVLALRGLDGVDVLGYVPSTDPYLDRAAVVVAPLRFGAGMKGKVTEAMAAGAPIVSTSIGAQGFGARHGEHLMIADDPSGFAEHVVALLKDPNRAEQLGAAGRDLLARLCAPDVVAGGLDRMFREVVEGRARARATPGWALGAAAWHGRRLARSVASATGLRRPRPAASPAPPARPRWRPDLPTPKISVLLPAYNAERYIVEAVESILDQTFDDFELIVIDDGSTDRTGEFLRRFAEEDQRVRLVSRPNAGLVATLNEMIDLARGELLARMDADDVARPERFERQVAYLENHPEVVCVGSKVIITDEAGRHLQWGHPGMDHDEIVALGLTGACPLSHPSVMMRAEAVRAIGGYRADRYPAEDLDLFLRLAEVGRLANLPEPLLDYRFLGQSISGHQQHLQLERSREVVAEASARLGLPDQFIVRPPWRPYDRASRQRFALWFGWAAFRNGDRRGAVEYGLKAIGQGPWHPEGWRLLACALAKLPAAGELKVGEASKS